MRQVIVYDPRLRDGAAEADVDRVSARENVARDAPPGPFKGCAAALRSA